MTDPVKVPNHLPRAELTTFEEAARLMIATDEMLARHGLSIAKGSDLEQQYLAVSYWEDRRSGKISLDPFADPRKEIREGVGAMHLVRLLLDTDTKSSPNPLVKHFRKLNDVTASVAQNTRTPFSDATNKLFELFVGAVCLSFASEVSLDDPDHSDGSNPDVLFAYGGKRWGLACKVPSGQSSLTLYERIEEGVRQIDHSAAEAGFVVINMRNQIDHDAFWRMLDAGNRQTGTEPTWCMWRSIEPATEMLLTMCQNRLRSLIEDNGVDAIRALVEKSRTKPSVLFFAQTTLMIAVEGQPVPTRLGLFHLWEMSPVSEDGVACLDAMNNALHHRPCEDEAH